MRPSLSCHRGHTQAVSAWSLELLCCNWAADAKAIRHRSGQPSRRMAAGLTLVNGRKVGVVKKGVHFQHHRVDRHHRRRPRAARLFRARAPLKGWVGGHSVAPDYFCALPLDVSRVRKVLPGLRPETPYETPTGGKAMQIDKQFAVDQLKKQGESAKAQKALDEPPAKIDHEGHAALLEKFGIDPGQLAEKAAKKGRRPVTATSGIGL